MNEYGLANVANVCKRLRCLAETYFTTTYKNTRKKIDMNSTEFEEEEYVLKVFGRFIVDYSYGNIIYNSYRDTQFFLTLANVVFFGFEVGECKNAREHTPANG